MNASLPMSPPAGIRDRLSPFLAWSEEDRAPLPDELLAAPDESIVVDLLNDPAAVVARLDAPVPLQRTVLASVAMIAAATSVLGLVVARAMGPGATFVTALLCVVDAFAALAAALGPIHATSVLLAARIPLARLVAIQLAGAAAGSVAAAALAPVVHVLWALDHLWMGPTALFLTFLAGAVVGGLRVWRLMHLHADRVSDGSLDVDDAFRVGVVARVAMMATALTSALAFWTFETFFRT